LSPGVVIGYTPGTVAAGDDSRIVGAMPKLSTQLLMSKFDTTAQGGDSTADFQAACNAAVAVIQTYGRCQLILDSKQHYYLKSAVTAGPNGEWAQVHLPFNGGYGVDQGSSWHGWFEMVGLPGGGTVLEGQQAAVGGTIIESTLTTAPAFNSAVGIASMIGTVAAFQYTGPHAGSLLHQFIAFSFKDVNLRQPANPPITCLDLGWSGGMVLDNVVCSVPSISDSNYTQPTSPQAVGVIYPFETVWAYTKVPSLYVWGFYAGICLGEIAQTDLYYGQWNYINVAVDSAWHGNQFSVLNDNQCSYGFAALDPASGVIAPTRTGKGSAMAALNASPVVVGYWQQQQTPNLPAWANRVWDVYDPNGVLPLDAVTSRMAVAGGGYSPPLLSGGCGQVSVRNLFDIRGDHSNPSLTSPDFRILSTPVALVQGGTALAYNATIFPLGAIRYNPSPVQNDGAIWQALVPCGVWTLTLKYMADSAYAILTLDYSLDGGATWTALGTIDSYAASPTISSSTLSLNTGNVGTGNIRLRVRVLSKNASSTGYSYAVSAAVLTRT